MNQDIIKGKWKQVAGQAQMRWNRLTDDDVGVADGHREYLVGKLQERYGWAREQADDEVRSFESRLQ